MADSELPPVKEPVVERVTTIMDTPQQSAPLSRTVTTTEYKPPEIHKHAYWLFGVVVGLAIKEALTAVVPHLMARPTDTLWWAALEDFVRLVMFLFLIVRFYLGSAYYFEEAYAGPNATKYPTKNYFLDFLCGMVHFVSFFAWALAIDFHDDQRAFFFRYILVWILLFDVLWFVLCKQYSTRHLMKLWMVINLFTAFVSVPIWLLAVYFELNLALAEALAFLPIFVASIIDMAELTTGRRLFAEWLSKIARGIRGIGHEVAESITNLTKSTED